jgi:hypothetical protein
MKPSPYSVFDGNSIRPHEPEAERNELVLEPPDSKFPGHLEQLKPYAGDAAEKERLEIA